MSLAEISAAGWGAVLLLAAAGFAHLIVAWRFGTGHRHEVAARWISFTIFCGVVLVGSVEVRSYLWGGPEILGDPARVFLLGGVVWVVAELAVLWRRERARRS
ncbi:MAG: hypothetical protein Q8M66_02180 [Actinomycetota bacterium]|nr:hypothetical protein [Actinomycetota bacterium]MDZ4180444.1 hypothetical protein [Coriobacteriia bacterium]